jgi:transcriptional regulator with XRE-family HTH domain
MDTVTSINKSLSERLKHYRRLKNFSQESLAEAAGISVRTIQRIETGDSIGSAYTIEKLAITLGIDVSELTNELTLHSFDDSNARKQLKLLNLSTLSVILIPLSNIILPLFILSKNKDKAGPLQNGRKIINFQIVWTVITMVLIILVPLLLLPFKSFRGSSVPLSIPVYYICVMVNVYFTLLFSVAINDGQPFLNRIPNIL